MTEDEKERLYKRLGERIREFRKETPSRTQTELGDEVELSRTSIANIERGRQHPPLHVIWKIAEALKVDLGELLPSKHEVAGLPSDVDPETARWIQKALDKGEEDGESDSTKDDETVRLVAQFMRSTQD